MKTSTPHETISEEEFGILSTLHLGGASLEMPLQQMFDEFVVFISKTDFE